MARGTQHRKRRPQANARVATPQPKPRRQKHERWEDQLFFSRLRVHAKWIFLLLAIVFAFSFVIFGVGSGSTGISDALQNFFGQSASSGASISSLQKKTQEHPKLASAWLNLSTALQAKGRSDEAITALKQYTVLRPKDTTELEALAALYSRQATTYSQIYTDAQTKTQILSPTLPTQPSSTSDLGKAFASLSNPISSAVSSVIGTDSSTAYEKALEYETDTVSVYKQLAKLTPKDAPTQLQLGQAAANANDLPTAIAAFKKFLKLAPDDPTAPQVKKVLKQLEAAQKSEAATATKSASKK